MRVSEVLSGSVETFLTMTPKMQDHLDRADNPHKITKSQVGLGNVTDEKQATDADFRSHTSAPVLDHPASSVTTEKLQNGAVTAEKIAAGAVGEAALGNDSVGEDHLQEALRSQINGKVDKAEGMGLSQNSFTDAEKAKLGAISIKDGASLAVDTTTLVLKSEPLCLKKTGTRLTKEIERVTVTPNIINRMITATSDLQNGETHVVGINDMNLLAVFRVQNGKLLERPFGSSTSVIYRRFEGRTFFGEVNTHVVFIREFMSSANVWKKFTIKNTSAVLQDFHILPDRVLIVYTCDANEGEMHVESFTWDGVREWEFVTASAPRENYADTDAYSTRFSKSVIVGEDICIAPVLDQTNGHAVLRLDKNGTCTKMYMPITSYTLEDDVLLGLTFAGKSIYGFISAGYLVRIDTETGKTYKAYCEGSEAALLGGLQIGRGEKVGLYTRNAETGIYRFFKIDGKTVSMEKDQFPEMEVVADLDKNYLNFCFSNEGYEFLYFENGAVNSHIYAVADTYTVL